MCAGATARAGGTWCAAPRLMPNPNNDQRQSKDKNREENREREQQETRQPQGAPKIGGKDAPQREQGDEKRDERGET